MRIDSTLPRRRDVLQALLAAPLACAFGLRNPGQFYFVEDRPSMQSLARNAGRIGLLCPAWYAFNAEGRLEATIGPVTAATIARHKMQVIPLIVNKGFDKAAASVVLNDAARRARAIAGLSAAAEKNKYAGYELDFENIDAADRMAYVSFVAELASALRKSSRTLSVSVPAPLLPAQPGEVYRPTASAPAFDYRELARHADWISLMAYDEHTEPNQPGPIASAPWVEACVVHLLAALPPAKLKLGVPLYHRRWAAGKVTEGSYAEAELIASAHGAAMKMRPAEREIGLEFAGPEGPESIWVHSAASLKTRLEMVKRYELAGYAAWRLGQEDPEIWSGGVV